MSNDLPRPTTRPRYFDNELLDDVDFALEQSYHADHMRRHECLLHVAGITEGLGITKKSNKVLLIGPGGAIDEYGRHILLELEYELTVNQPSGESLVVVEFTEVFEVERPGFDQIGKRFTQMPTFRVVVAAGPGHVVLGKVIWGPGGLTLDNTVRVYSGVRFPGSTVNLRSTGAADRVTLRGALDVTGALSIGGPVVVGVKDSPQDLTVTGAVNVGTLSVPKSLTVNGPTTIGSKISPQDLWVNGSVTLGSVAPLPGTSVQVNGALVVGSKLSPRNLLVTGEVTLSSVAPLAGASVQVNGALVVGTKVSPTNLTVNGGLTVKSLTGANIVSASWVVDEPYEGYGGGQWPSVSIGGDLVVAGGMGNGMKVSLMKTLDVYSVGTSKTIEVHADAFYLCNTKKGHRWKFYVDDNGNLQREGPGKIVTATGTPL